MNRRKIGNIICFIISLFLLGIGISLGRFIVLSGMFDLISNDVVGGIALVGAMFAVAFIPLAISLIVSGIILAVVAIHLAKNSKKKERQEESAIQEGQTENNLLVTIEIVIYVIWIGLYIFLGA